MAVISSPETTRGERPAVDEARALVEIPVTYGGASGPELDDVAPTTARGRLFIRLASRLWHAETEARAARPLRGDRCYDHHREQGNE